MRLYLQEARQWIIKRIADEARDQPHRLRTQVAHTEADFSALMPDWPVISRC